MKKIKWWIVAGIGIVLSGIVGLLIIIMIIFSANLNSSCDNSDNSDSSTNIGVVGEWTKQGTEAYNTAKEIFEYWVKKGMSGAAAAGVVGNVSKESNFQKEISDGGSGKGLYQFTPYTKFTKWSRFDHTWSVTNQSDFVYDSEAKPGLIFRNGNTGFVMRTVDYYRATDPKKAAADWENGYERPASIKDAAYRAANAQKAYELFGGASINANNDIIEGSDSGSDTGAINQATDDSLECGNDDDIVSGKWIFPFKSISKKGPKLVDGGQFGTSAGSSFRKNSFHDGIDLGDATYTGDIQAIHGGKIVKICQPGDHGLSFWLVWEVTNDGYGIAYQEFGDLNDIYVREGDVVKTGDIIGVSKAGGQWSHLHLGISKEKNLFKALGKSFTDDGTWLDPVKVIKKGLENE